MAYLLRPRTIEEKLGRPYALWWSGNRRGVSLVKTSGVWSEVEFPDNITLDAADAFFLGGHEYVIDQAVYDELTAAGFGSYVEVTP